MHRWDENKQVACCFRDCLTFIGPTFACGKTVEYVKFCHCNYSHLRALIVITVMKKKLRKTLFISSLQIEIVLLINWVFLLPLENKN